MKLGPNSVFIFGFSQNNLIQNACINPSNFDVFFVGLTSFIHFLISYKFILLFWWLHFNFFLSFQLGMFLKILFALENFESIRMK